jgi:DNA-binding protein HU-beta
MKKDDMIKQLADQSDLTNAQAKKAFDAVFQVITKGLQEEESVSIAGFGIFKVKKRAATKGRNPRTGDPIDIPAKNITSFTASKSLKEAINAQT